MRLPSKTRIATVLSATSLLIWLALVADNSVSCKIIEPDLPRKPASCEIAFTTVAKGGYSGIKTSERLAIREEGTWLTVWHRHTSDKRASDTAPHVDFEKNMVVAIFQGEANAKAGLIQVDSIKLFKDKMVVLVNEGAQSSGKGALSTTRSFHMVRIPRSSLPVAFR
ncbi:MAG: hypothetical protein K8F91_01930 [Candidatus Obscuribacterales bacterium]|nr:hypothetical protein [Candidatus Obscuribacterales bacterium]